MPGLGSEGGMAQSKVSARGCRPFGTEQNVWRGRVAGLGRGRRGRLGMMMMINDNKKSAGAGRGEREWWHWRPFKTARSWRVYWNVGRGSSGGCGWWRRTGLGGPRLEMRGWEEKWENLAACQREELSTFNFQLSWRRGETDEFKEEKEEEHKRRRRDETSCILKQ
jgi:hypothetical protein